MCRSYANITPFYIRDLGIHGFWYPGDSWNQISADTEGQPYLAIPNQLQWSLDTFPVSPSDRGRKSAHGNLLVGQSNFPMFSLTFWTFFSLCLGCSPLAIPCPSFFKVKIPAQRWDVSLDLTASQGLSQNHLMVVSVCTIGWPLRTVERFPQLLGGLSSIFSSGIVLSRREPPCKRSHPLSQLRRAT